MKKNLLANFLGKCGTTLLSFLFLPFYIKLIGIEAYGLVGFYITLAGLLSLLDLGISTTVNREIPRMIANVDTKKEIGNFIRTFEFIFWGTSLFVAIVTTVLAPYIAGNWIKSSQLTFSEVKNAVILMGFALAFSWPSFFYSSNLIGLQKHVLNNFIFLVSTIARFLITFSILLFISPTIHGFFIGYLVSNIFQALLFAYVVWRNIPAKDISPKFNKTILKQNLNFASKMTIISIISVIIPNVDKIVLSKVLSLEMFGYYSLASSLAGGLSNLIMPVYSTFFPKFSQLVAMDQKEELKKSYHTGSQVMSILIIPVALFVIFFSSELLHLWLGNPKTVENTSQFVPLLMIGSLLNGFAVIPYALQIAFGWTRLVIYQNVISLIILIPLMIWGTKYYGAFAAASFGIAINLINVFLMVPLMHRKILEDEKKKWYLYDIGLPFIGAVLISLISRAYFPQNISAIYSVILLTTIFLTIFLVSCFLTQTCRSAIYETARKRLFLSNN